MFFQFIFGELNAYVILLEFLCASSLVILGGIKITTLGDDLGTKLGLNKAWIGFVILAFITTQPELISSVGAITFVRGPNLAFGVILGSVMFNVVIIAISDLVYRSPQSILSSVSSKHVFLAALVMMSTGVVSLGMYLMPVIPEQALIIFSLLIVVIYLLGNKLVFKYENSDSPKLMKVEGGTGKILLLFLAWSLVIVASGVWLVHVADVLSIFPFSIGETTIILGHNWVGSVLLAIVTSFPEIIVSIWAVRLGSLDMAIGNVFGANFCDLFFIPILDGIYRTKYKVSIFQEVSQLHIFSSLVAMLLTAVVIAGLIYKPTYKKRLMGWETLLLVGIYLASASILYLLR